MRKKQLLSLFRLGIMEEHVDIVKVIPFEDI